MRIARSRGILLWFLVTHVASHSCSPISLLHLPPGEYCEWILKLKPGQIVFAEAHSEAFDAALEIVGEDKKVLASNDDRFPGDQSPLLCWRCEKEGSYALHVRCFHDKSGGQFL